MESLPQPSTATPPSTRIVSVDVLRGFDMFWIVGGGSFVSALLRLCGPKVDAVLGPQLHHAAWEGFRFFDLIFPLFVFLVGMSTVFSLERLLAEQGKRQAYQRLLWRTVCLFLLGILYYGGLSHPWPEIRLLGVLQRIALCYLFTGIAFIHLRTRGLVLLFAVLLLGYWAWLSFVPLPGQETISFEVAKNWANYLDAQFLPGRRNDGTWDPEGLLSTLPAIATCLLGVFAARLLRNPRLSERSKVAWLFGGGLLCLALGYAWGLQFPVIKKIWTSSYVLVAGGYSLLLLGLFYLVIDLWKIRGWIAPFLWIGTNAITIYMACNLVDFRQLASRLVGGDLQETLGDPWGKLLLATVSLGLTLLLARFLYRRQIFLRL